MANKKYIPETRLLTTPTFEFSQGDFFEDGCEPHVNVSYWKGSNDNEALIELEQEGGKVLFTNLAILKKLVLEVEVHYSQAVKVLYKNDK